LRQLEKMDLALNVFEMAGNKLVRNKIDFLIN